MKAPSKDLMNSLTRSVLTLASYDDDIGKTDLQTQLEQCIKLISVFPMLAVYGYHAYHYYECDGSMYIHRPRPELSTAENLLQMLRPDRQYTDLEAHVLDIALLLHMEHGGGNNSTFTTRVVTSSGVGHLLGDGRGALQPERPQARRRQHQGHADDGRCAGARGRPPPTRRPCGTTWARSWTGRPSTRRA